MRFFLRSSIAGLAIAAVTGLVLPVTADADGGTLRAAIDASDVPMASSQPSHGATGMRWMGWTIFDALMYWNLTQDKTMPVETPALAESWTVPADQPTKWIFKLRRGVKFHDGTDFNADAVIWNVEKIFDKSAPQYDDVLRGNTLCCMLDLKAWRKIDDYTVELETNEPDATSPERFTYLRMASPTAWKRAGSWTEFIKKPVGTGPYRVEEIVPRERAVLVRNEHYWDKNRIPKLEKLIIMPIPDAQTRASALLAGQVDFIENAPTDAIAKLKARGKTIITNRYPHIWPYWFRMVGENTPFKDVRVRQALNLAVDRDGIVALVGGYAVAAKGHVLPESPWFGNPKFKLRYDPAEAKRLLAEAGYGPSNPLKITFLISSGGSGQMQPLAMNELVQQNFKDVGVQLDFKVLEWQAFRLLRNKGPLDESNWDIQGVNNSWDNGIKSGFETLFGSGRIAPKGFNWGIQDPVLDEIFRKVKVTFDPKEQDKLVAQAHERMVDNAYWLWVVHEINVHAVNPNVKNFKPAISWHVDYTQLYVE